MKTHSSLVSQVNIHTLTSHVKKIVEVLPFLSPVFPSPCPKDNHYYCNTYDNYFLPSLYSYTTKLASLNTMF